MELEEDEVQTVEDAADIVRDLQRISEDTEALSMANLVLLEEQLNALHESLALAVAQKEGMAEDS